MISVIVPVFNVKDYVKDALNSIINQTYQNFEIIIVDDGSTDGSSQILKKFEKKYSCVKLIKIKNSGLSAARNIGIRQAKGDYLYFLDSDDIANVHLFEICMELFKQFPTTDLVTFGFRNFSGSIDNNLEVKIEEKNFFDQERLLKGLISGEIYQMAWSYLCKRSLFLENDISFSEGRLFEDNNVAAKLFASVRKVLVIKTDPDLYYYRQRDGSITKESNRNFTKRELLDEIFIFSDEYKILRNNLSVREANKWYINKLTHLYIKYYLSLQGTAELNNLRERALKFDTHGLKLPLRTRIRLLRVRYRLFDKFIRLSLDAKK